MRRAFFFGGGGDELSASFLDLSFVLIVLFFPAFCLRFCLFRVFLFLSCSTFVAWRLGRFAPVGGRKRGRSGSLGSPSWTRDWASAGGLLRPRPRWIGLGRGEYGNRSRSGLGLGARRPRVGRARGAKSFRRALFFDSGSSGPTRRPFRVLDAPGRRARCRFWFCRRFGGARPAKLGPRPSRPPLIPPPSWTRRGCSSPKRGKPSMRA